MATLIYKKKTLICDEEIKMKIKEIVIELDRLTDAEIEKYTKNQKITTAPKQIKDERFGGIITRSKQKILGVELISIDDGLSKKKKITAKSNEMAKGQKKSSDTYDKGSLTTTLEKSNEKKSGRRKLRLKRKISEVHTETNVEDEYHQFKDKQITSKFIKTTQRSKVNKEEVPASLKQIDEEKSEGKMTRAKRRAIEALTPQNDIKIDDESQFKEENGMPAKKKKLSKETILETIEFKQKEEKDDIKTVAVMPFSTGEVIWCKIRGAVHWPAKILLIGTRQIEVEWFNDYRTSKVFRSQIYKFYPNFRLFAEKFDTTVGLKAAAQEAMIHIADKININIHEL